MSLHDTLIANVLYVYRWYNAFNARAGRAHLFKVPLVRKRWVYISEYDRNDMDARRMTEFITRQNERNLWAFPRYFRETEFMAPFIRQCERPQDAVEWESHPDWRDVHLWDHRPPRNWCEYCWTVMTNLSDSVIMPIPARNQSNSAPSMFVGQTIDQWMLESAGWTSDGGRGLVPL